MNANIYSPAYFAEGDAYERRPDRLKRLIARIFQFDHQTVLDVGCGQGYLVAELKRHKIAAVGMDISPYAGKKCPGSFVLHDATDSNFPFPDKAFDVVVSADFFEHLPEDDIDFVYSEMQRVAFHVVAWICYKQEKRKNTPPSHLTVKPKEWWLKKLPGVILI